MDGVSDLDGYRLSRDNAASIRLNAQHYLWKAVCGFNLHPTVLSCAGPKMKIADVATGTGIWITDVKSENPGYSIDGLDISLKLCPPESQWPPGCTYRQLDMLGEVPEELRGIYDVVHVRLVLGALANDPIVALKNFITLLKPGGYLQWQEFNLKKIGVTAMQPGLKQTATAKVVETVQSFGFGEWVSGLAATCADHGLVECRTDKYLLQPHLAIPFCQTEIGAYEEISRVAMDNSSPESQGPRFRQLLGKALQELMTGVWIDQALEVTIAHKSR